MYYVYVLRCEDGSLYCGSTADYKKRIREHFLRLPAAAKYTKSHKAVGIECVWKVGDKSSAMKLEYRFKKLPRSKKILLLDCPFDVGRFITELEGCSFLPVLDVKLEDCLK